MQPSKTGAFNLIPKNFNENLLESLVNYETITVYNKALKLLPVKKIEDKNARTYAEQALTNINYWENHVAKSFESIFLGLKSLLESKYMRLISMALNNILTTPKSPEQKIKVTTLIKNYKGLVIDYIININTTIKHVDEFRKKINGDSQNFEEINTKLHIILNQKKEKIKEKIASLNEVQKIITKTNQELRKEYLYIETLKSNIAKVGITCATFKYVSETAIAVFFTGKSPTEKIKNLENRLQKNKETYQKVNDELLYLAKQAPLLASLMTQIQSLYSLSLQSANIAQTIKRNWDNINFNLEAFIQILNNINQYDRLSDYIKNKLEKKFTTAKNEIETTIKKYERSNQLGIPLDKKIQEIFEIFPFWELFERRRYPMDSESGILYVPIDKFQ
ncbi:MAG: hypothetical protein V4471_02590 [Pseudomonadota bacterium]